MQHWQLTGLLLSRGDSTAAISTNNIPFHLPCNSALPVILLLSFFFCITKMNDLCASNGLKRTALHTPDAHSAHCSVSHFKCRKFITHASLILSCICIVWSLRCWMCWKKELCFYWQTKLQLKQTLSTLFSSFLWGWYYNVFRELIKAEADEKWQFTL